MLILRMMMVITVMVMTWRSLRQTLWSLQSQDVSPQDRSDLQGVQVLTRHLHSRYLEIFDFEHFTAASSRSLWTSAVISWLATIGYHHFTQSGRKCVIVASSMRAKQRPCEPIKGCISEIREPEYAREWQWEPARARVGVRESHRERSSKSQREPVKAWESKLKPEGATFIHLEGLLQKRS